MEAVSGRLQNMGAVLNNQVRGLDWVPVFVVLFSSSQHIDNMWGNEYTYIPLIFGVCIVWFERASSGVQNTCARLPQILSTREV